MYFILNFFYLIETMGCQESRIQNISDEEQEQNEQQQFKLSYRQFVMNSRGDVLQFYHFSSFVQRSPTGIIRKVYHRTNRLERICKIVPLANFDHLSALQQVEILKGISHPNLPTIHQYFIEKNHAYLIFQKIEGVTLLQQLKYSKQLTLHSVLNIMTQLLSLISMMHAERIAHRAIHPNHIMVQPQADGNFFLRVLDLSSAVYVDQKKYKSVKPSIQTVFNSIQTNTHPIGHDIYCCGLIFFILLGGHNSLKFIRKNEKKVIQNLIQKNPSIKDLKEILLEMMDPDPLARPTALKILQNPNFTKYNQQARQDAQKIKILFRNLMKFNIKGKLRTTLWMFASITLQNKHQKFQFLSQFYTLDKNKDGKIDFQQLCQGIMDSFGVDREEAEQQASSIFKNLDKNNNGFLDFYEFVLGTFTVTKALSNHQLQIIFSQIDTNKDGIITEEELNQAISDIEDYKLLDRSAVELDFKAFKRIMESYIKRISEEIS